MTIEITSMKITDRALGTVTRLRRDKYGKEEKTDRYGS